MAIQEPMQRTARAPVIAAPTSAEVTKRKLARVWETAQPYLYLLPALLAVGVWVYRPLIQTFELSFYQWNLLPTRPKIFVGFENYLQVLDLPEMLIALRNTGIYIIGLMPLTVVLPLIVAILVAKMSPGPKLMYRAIIFLPVLVPPVVTAVVWRWILHPLQGIVNTTLNSWFGIAPINWFRDENLTIWVIVAITGWGLLGFAFLIFSAGLTGISKDYLDAAAIDGASEWQQIWHITLPLMTPTITFMIMMTVLLSNIWVFPLVNVLTQGGPLDATTNLYYQMYEFGFRTFAVGWSSAAAVLYFIVFSLIAWGMVKFMDRFSFYDA
ncbi:MAG: sugar ABC transporter permease [Dehalococcoidia bacterium]|nr:sugar ABC transporter permease [Dehalococcoidia bacterium]